MNKKQHFESDTMPDSDSDLFRNEARKSINMFSRFLIGYIQLVF